MAIPGVRNFGSHIGRAEVADEVVGAELHRAVDQHRPDGGLRRDGRAKIQEVVDGYPGLYRDLLTYLRERIKEVLTGASATIVVRIFGPGPRRAARQRRRRSSAAHGRRRRRGRPARSQAQVLVPQIEVRLRPEPRPAVRADAGRTCAATATTLVQGTKVGEVYEEQKIFDVVVWGMPAAATDVDALRALPIDTPAGGTVPLGEVADVDVAPTPNEITREGGSRRIDVTCNVARPRPRRGGAGHRGRLVQRDASSAAITPKLLGEYAGAARRRRRLLAARPAARCSASSWCCTRTSGSRAAGACSCSSRCRSRWSAAWSRRS